MQQNLFYIFRAGGLSGKEVKSIFDSHYKYTPKEYWRLAEALPEHKYEYSYGTIRMMTGGSPAHGQIAANIIAFLVSALRSHECNVYSRVSTGRKLMKTCKNSKLLISLKGEEKYLQIHH